MVTNALTDLRTQVVTDLSDAGLPAVEYVAERVAPPVVVVVPGSPYVAAPDGDGTVPFGAYDVHLDVLAVAGKGTNRATAEWVDDTVIAVLAALGDDWDVTEVGQPSEVQINGQAHLGAVVSLEQTVRLG